MQKRTPSNATVELVDPLEPVFGTEFGAGVQRQGLPARPVR